MRTEYFAQNVCGWKPNCQLDLVLMIDTGGTFPLYSSPSHDLPNEQLGHDWGLQSKTPVEISPGPGHGVPPRCMGSKDLLLLVLWGAEEGVGGGSGSELHQGTSSSSGCQGAAPSSHFMSFVAVPSHDSAERELGWLSWWDKMSCSWNPFVSRLKRIGRLWVPYAYCLGTVALYHRLSLVSGQEESTALRSASKTGTGHRPAFQCNAF